MVGMHPGHGWWACIRDTDGAYGCALKERRIVRARVSARVGDATIRGVSLEPGNVRGLIPRALPWAGMRCSLGAGIAQGSRHRRVRHGGRGRERQSRSAARAGVRGMGERSAASKMPEKPVARPHPTARIRLTAAPKPTLLASEAKECA